MTNILIVCFHMIIHISLSSLSGKARPLSDAWEWREGRLLAYELILQFLIKNHWVYTFGPPHLSGPPAVPHATALPKSNVRASADEAFWRK